MNESKEKNIIRRQIFDLNYYGITDAFMLRQGIESLCKENLIPQIEAAIDKWNIPGRFIRIDELKIEVNDLDSISFEKELVPKVIEALGRAWNEKVKTSTDSNIARPYSVSLLDQLEFFLNHGYLPWFAQSIPAEEWFKLMEKAVDEAEEEQLSDLKQVLTLSTARERFAQLPSVIFWNIIRQINSWSSTSVRMIQYDLENLISTEGEVKKRFEKRYKFLIAEETLTGSPEKPEIILSKLLHTIINEGAFSIEQLKVVDWRSDFFYAVVQQIQKNDIEQVKQSSKENNKGPIILLEEKENRSVNPGTEEGIYILNAGLVIAAPYLNQFFSKLGFTEGNKLKETEQALALVNFIVTGSETYAEFELPLPKILCGIPIEKVVDTTITIKEEFKIEALELLNSIIRNWRALKKTSIYGLREGFLQRAGRLSYENNDWLLEVEQKSQDILLGQLPWSISFIYLPWMNNKLKVNWA